MFSIRHNKKSYTVTFRMDDNVLRIGKHGFEKVEIIGAFIHDENMRTIASGTAFKSERDLADDEHGMKLALSRALKFVPDKTLRAKFRKALLKAFIGERLSAQANFLAQRKGRSVAGPAIVGPEVVQGYSRVVVPFPVKKVADVRL